MKVKMLRQTRYNGQVFKIGDDAEIDEATAARWISRGIAKLVSSGKYDGMSAKQLYEKCMELGIEEAVPKKSAKFYIELLENAESSDEGEAAETEGEIVEE